MEVKRCPFNNFIHVRKIFKICNKNAIVKNRCTEHVCKTIFTGNFGREMHENVISVLLCNIAVNCDVRLQWNRQIG